MFDQMNLTQSSCQLRSPGEKRGQSNGRERMSSSRSAILPDDPVDSVRHIPASLILPSPLRVASSKVHDEQNEKGKDAAALRGSGGRQGHGMRS